MQLEAYFLLMVVGGGATDKTIQYAVAFVHRRQGRLGVVRKKSRQRAAKRKESADESGRRYFKQPGRSSPHLILRLLQGLFWSN